jgi:hypothetical protein
VQQITRRLDDDEVIASGEGVGQLVGDSGHPVATEGNQLTSDEAGQLVGR